MVTGSGKKLGIGVIGCGHWGPNHVRVFSELEHAEITACADLNRSRLDKLRIRYPHVTVAHDYRELLDNPSVNAVVIATPTATHARIAGDALRAGRHVLVEKPMCTTGVEGLELVRLAEQTGLVFMVGYVFVFNSGIVKLRELIAQGELGRILYLDAVRTNLGPIRGDVNALYDLGTHDISIFNYLLGASPIEVSAQGRCISQQQIEDVCFATLKYPNGTLGHIHVSWLNPRKVRTITVVGETKMAHWDDVDPSDTLRIYDRGVDEPPYYDSFGEFQYLLRSGDMRMPAIRRSEPLMNQAHAFVEWIRTGKQTGPDAKDGLSVVRVLESAMSSMHQGFGMRSVPSDATVLASAEQASRGVVQTGRPDTRSNSDRVAEVVGV